MPLENLDEEGLPRNPDLQLAQLRFLLTIENETVDKEAVWVKLLSAIKEKGIIILILIKVPNIIIIRNGSLLFLVMS